MTIDFMNYIAPELLVLVPVLYAIGAALKHAGWFKDTRIPVAIGVFGVALASLYVLATTPIAAAQDATMAVFTAIVQGVLCAAMAVYVNQGIKQAKKDA